MITFVKRLILKNVFKSAYRPGTYYSTIPDIAEVTSRSESIFAKDAPGGVDLNESNQIQFLRDCVPFIAGFKEFESSGGRYSPDNIFFNKADAFALYLMLRFSKPKRIVEVGSGFSSAVMLDVNEQFLNRSISFSFIEPYPDRLLSLLKNTDQTGTLLKKNKVQDVPLEEFKTLQENDILFIDSSHVSKVGSDLNYLLFNVLPSLHKGVIVHFHDIFYPFEYPKDWIQQGIHWNENYLLRAFLMFNSSFEIVLFSDFIGSRMPEDLKQRGYNFRSGASIYLRKKV